MKRFRIEKENSFRFYKSLFCVRWKIIICKVCLIYTTRNCVTCPSLDFFQICLQGMERKSRKDELNMTQYAAG